MKRVDVVPTAGHPIVYAEWLEAPGQPTVLMYGHYDVQPAEPFDLWESDPFDPTIRDGNLFARGSTDDKGQYPESDGGLQEVLNQWKDRCVNPEYDRVRKK